MAIAVILLAAVQQWLKKRSIKTVNQLFILLAIIALTPLPLIVTYGMERPLLLLFAFLFVSRMSDEWFSPEFSRTTLICGALMVATRYDGALLVALPCLLLLWRRKLLEAFELALWCLLPALVFGILAVFKENYFLPSPFMVMPVSSLVSYDWLVGCGIAVALPLLSGAGFQRLGHKTSRVAGVAATLIALMLCTKNMYAFREARRSSLEAYRLEYPAAQFVRRYYFRYGIVSDDVGSISFLTEGRYVDLSGNASIKIARSRGHHSPDPNLVNQLSMEKRTHVAIVSDKYARALPQNWVRTASWQWNGVAGEESKTLYFYALDSITAGVLKPELEEFAYFLPKNVTARYFFNPR
jgi:hypothetical protein